MLIRRPKVLVAAQPDTQHERCDIHRHHCQPCCLDDVENFDAIAGGADVALLHYKPFMKANKPPLLQQCQRQANHEWNFVHQSQSGLHGALQVVLLIKGAQLALF